MKKRILGKSILLVSGLFWGMQASATPSAEMLAYTCAGCHGTNGASTGESIPSLAGLAKPYLVAAMNEYKHDERNPTIMNRIAKGYTDKEFELMGDFFAKQPVHIHKQKFDSGMAKKGAKLHDKYCEKCHEEGGTSAEDEAGQLLGNASLYFKYSLEDFLDGSRDMPKKMKKKMKKMMKKDPKALEKLANFYDRGEN